MFSVASQHEISMAIQHVRLSGGPPPFIHGDHHGKQIPSSFHFTFYHILYFKQQNPHLPLSVVESSPTLSKSSLSGTNSSPSETESKSTPSKTDSFYVLRLKSNGTYFSCTSIMQSLIGIYMKNYTQCPIDTSLFTKGYGQSLVLFLEITKVHTRKRNSLQVLGDLRYFLALEIAKYALQLLVNTSFIIAKSLPIPMDLGMPLNEIDGDCLEDVSRYYMLIGRLTYLTISRPNIAYFVNNLSHFIRQLHYHTQINHWVLNFNNALTTLTFKLLWLKQLL
ncbi:hypothetical protein CR513_47049, partial [Mucuna pruriens]